MKQAVSYLKTRADFIDPLYDGPALVTMMADIHNLVRVAEHVFDLGVNLR
jgi:hypothetical protein